MKIKSLYIAAFGGIKDMRLDFSDGFNTVYGQNENGKSTVMAFIKMMFYGSDKGSSQISKNIRKKYTPWDAGRMAGSIDFVHAGRNYRLEREFRSSNSTDKATLCDLDFGTRQAAAPDIGIKFFGLSSAAFERSVFIGQFGFPENDTAAEGEINSRLANLALTGDESVSFETVNSRLEKAKLTLMSKSGRAGEYDKTVKRISETEQQLNTISENKSEFDRRMQDIVCAQKKIEAMKEKAAGLKEIIASGQDIVNAQKLRDFLQLKSELDRINAELMLSDGSYADELYSGKLKFCINKVQNAALKRKSKEGEIKTLEKSLDAGLNPPEDATEENARMLATEIDRLNAGIAETEKHILSLKEQPAFKGNFRKSKLWMIFLLLAVICTAAAVLAFALDLTAVAVGAAAADAVFICMTAAALISASSAERAAADKQSALAERIQKLENSLAQSRNSVFEKRVKLEAVTAALSSNETALQQRQELLETAQKELSLFQSEENAALETLFGLVSRYKKADTLEQVLETADEISQKSSKQKEIKNQLNFISRDIGSVTCEEAREKLDKLNGESLNYTKADLDRMKADYDKCLNDISESMSAVAAAKASAEGLIEEAGKTESLKRELAALKSKAESQERFCRAADTAMETLRESFGEVRRSYGVVLEKNAGEIFSMLTGNRYSQMSISKSFDINVSQTDNFGSREIAYLSSGTADQAYLSMRLGITKLMCGDKEPLPLMLDDSLAQYDDERMSLAVDFLKKYSGEFQIIMFTCHNSIKESAAEAGAEILYLQK